MKVPDRFYGTNQPSQGAMSPEVTSKAHYPGLPSVSQSWKYSVHQFPSTTPQKSRVEGRRASFVSDDDPSDKIETK